MKHTLLFIIIILLTNGTYSQKSEKEQKITFKFKGFVKTDFWYDTRQTAGALNGLFNLYPKDIQLDANGRDINATPSFNYSAIMSRAGVLINGLDVFGAKTTAFLEGDFATISSTRIATMRLRQAYIKMQWTNSSLLLGQSWHPIFVTDVFPSVLSLNTGAPMQAFVRNPQIRYTHNLGKFEIIGAILTQREFASTGPVGKTYNYMSNGLIPNTHLQVKYKTSNSIIGAAIDFKSLRPRLVTDSNLYTDSRINSISYMIYHKYKTKKIELKSKVILGENMYDALMLGGYAVASRDPLTNEETYTPTQHISAWIDFDYFIKKKKATIIPGLFVGYTENLGTKEDNIGVYYARSSNINSVIRISPSIGVKSGNILYCLEWEYTNAQYGTPTKSGIVENTHSVANNRIIMGGFFFF